MRYAAQAMMIAEILETLSGVSVEVEKTETNLIFLLNFTQAEHPSYVRFSPENPCIVLNISHSMLTIDSQKGLHLSETLSVFWSALKRKEAQLHELTSMVRTLMLKKPFRNYSEHFLPAFCWKEGVLEEEEVKRQLFCNTEYLIDKHYYSLGFFLHNDILYIQHNKNMECLLVDRLTEDSLLKAIHRLYKTDPT